MFRSWRVCAQDVVLYVAAACGGFLFAWISAAVHDGIGSSLAHSERRLLEWLPWAAGAAAVLGPVMGFVAARAKTDMDSLGLWDVLARFVGGVARVFALFVPAALLILVSMPIAMLIGRRRGWPQRNAVALGFPLWFLLAPVIGRSASLAVVDVTVCDGEGDEARRLPATAHFMMWLAPLLASLFVFSGATSVESGARVDVVFVASLGAFLLGELAVLDRVVNGADGSPKSSA